MIPREEQTGGPTTDTPRMSGDDPYISIVNVNIYRYSPHERG